MNGTQMDSATALPPTFWYDIPQGYHQLDVYPTTEHMEERTRQLRSLPENLRDRADQVFRLYAAVIWGMQKQRVQGCLLGMHPDDRGGVTTSVVTLSSVQMPGINPKAVLATLLDSSATTTPENGVVPVELPTGPGYLTVSVRNATVPGSAPRDGGEPAQEPVWQGTVAIPDTRSSAIIAVQLVTSSVDLADDYRNVLLGVARTVTFADPTRTEGAGGTDEPRPGSAAEAVRNDFG